MADGQPTVIMPQGIVRNRTKIGVEDGMAEDLLNLRFVDGSWRTSGDGRLINFTMGQAYEQLYIHTNVYRHLLGVYNGTLYWFASIGTDGVTFYPLDCTTDRTNWPDEFQDLPTSPVALTTVHGNLWITQTGHLLTVIDGEDDFEYYVFKTSTKEYIEVKVDANGKATNRTLFPFGQVHFNLFEPTRNSEYDLSGEGESYLLSEYDEVGNEVIEHRYTEHFTRIKPKLLDIQSLSQDAISKWATSIGITNDGTYTPDELFLQTYHLRASNYLKVVQAESDKRNLFTRPFLAIVALKLYDGSYAYASQPVLLCPREKPTRDADQFTLSYKEYRDAIASNPSYSSRVSEIDNNTDSDKRMIYNTSDGESFVYIPSQTLYDSISEASTTIKALDSLSGVTRLSFGYSGTDIVPAISNGVRLSSTNRYDVYQAAGCDIVLSADWIGNLDKSVFTHVAVFITPQAEIFDYSSHGTTWNVGDFSSEILKSHTISYIPKMREVKDIIEDLVHSPFFLLIYNRQNELYIF